MQQLELAFELTFDLGGTALGRKWLVDFNAGKTQLFLFDQFNNTGAIDVKMDGFVLERKSSFKGYLRYKMITSQNVSSEAQMKNFFIL